MVVVLALYHAINRFPSNAFDTCTVQDSMQYGRCIHENKILQWSVFITVFRYRYVS